MLALDDYNAAVVALTRGIACNLCGSRMRRTTCIQQHADHNLSGVPVACTRAGCEGRGVELLP